MSCTNCDNGCAEIVSDKCVKYTGVSIPSLGISNGDSLCSVEQALATFLQSALNGTGIVPTIDPDILTLCTLISDNLPQDPTLIDLVSALIQAACNLQNQVDEINSELDIIEADYTLPVSCLTGVSPSSGTHAILQAVITKLCGLNTSVTSIATNLLTNYSKNGTQLDNYIANYLATHSTSSTKHKNQMVPYVAYEYYGPLTNFDGSGVGSGDWEDVYLCNGSAGNGTFTTPDKRGRVAVGAIVGVGGASLTGTAVDPVVSGNPNYDLLDTQGVNFITLNATQVPNHSHTTVGSTATQAGHSHFVFNIDILNGSGAAPVTDLNYAIADLELADNLSYRIKGTNTVATLGKTSTESPAITPNILVNATVGGGNSHNNIQPSIACYYIMYIP